MRVERRPIIQASCDIRINKFPTQLNRFIDQNQAGALVNAFAGFPH